MGIRWLGPSRAVSGLPSASQRTGNRLIISDLLPENWTVQNGNFLVGLGEGERTTKAVIANGAAHVDRSKVYELPLGLAGIIAMVGHSNDVHRSFRSNSLQIARFD